MFSKHTYQKIFGYFAASLCLSFCGCGLINKSSEGLPTLAAPTPSGQEEPTPANVKTPSPAPSKEPTNVPTKAPEPTLSPTPEPTKKPAGTAGDVSFSETDYFLTKDTSLKLTLTSKKSGYITFTTDGTEPLLTSENYQGAILLTASKESTPNITVIKAKAFYDDGTVSKTYVHTYFVGETVKERYSTYVFSIIGDPAVLTDGPDGILFGENYKQRGDASEREIHIEALTSDGELLFTQFAGARVYGGTSREHAVKSLKLYARKDYEEGKGTFSFSEFGSLTADQSERIKKYDKLVLRNGGDDFQLGFLRDELLQRLSEPAGLDNHEAVLPVLAYVNGEYYGFYWLHESYCNKYFQNRNGKSDGEYIILEGSDQRKSLGDNAEEAAAAKELNALYADFSKRDLKKEENYSALCEKMDVLNYIDYMSYNMYSANYDWPQGNFRCFRYYAADGEEYGTGEMDGRWRFLPHDMDVGFGTYQSTADAGAKRNDLNEVLVAGKDRYSPLLAALLKRDDLKEYFINRMLLYMDGPLSYETVSDVLLSMRAERDTELSIYISYLRSLPDDCEIYSSEKSTMKHMERILSFAKQRPAYMTTYLEKFFSVDLPDRTTQNEEN